MNALVARESTYGGAPLEFAPVTPADDYLHPMPADAPFTSIETNVYGFSIPASDINCNIYALWHAVLNTMSFHIFVYRGRRMLPHQLAADYFNEHLYLPAVRDIADYRIQLGSCAVHARINEPLRDIDLAFEDAKRSFALELNYRAALPPVGRPGGKHFTQLMKTSGELTLEGGHFAIDGYYMRDRSWGYQRPEEPERAPPYRWVTGWIEGAGGRVHKSFVIAWMDTGLLDAPEFGPHWNSVVAGPDAKGGNKWESGGVTPSLNLRSGWIAVGEDIRPVTRMRVRTLLGTGSSLKVRGIEFEIEDARGETHMITGETFSMIPKMYWQNLLTYMHCMRYSCDGRTGHGDLMDTYSTYHVRKFGL